MSGVLLWQWGLVIGSSVLLYIISPVAKTGANFYQGASGTREQPRFITLTSSLVISWIFAKSITNAANLGLEFGIVGGLAYATYYFSFLVAGIVIYKLRTVMKSTSIHGFLRSRFGKSAVIVFSLLIGIRLLNEVWSNTMVIGTYFGEKGSPQFIAAVLAFSALTLAYSLKGGLRSSLITDMLQMALFGVLIFLILGIIIPREGSLLPFIQSSEWTMATGLNLLFAALIQVFSYPFHDPVLTDRGFISDAGTTLKSYLAATVIGFAAILMFSLVGIHARGQGLTGQAAVVVSRTVGLFMMLATNFIMITSAASTLDSAFSSVAKLGVVDLGSSGKATVTRGRVVMIVAALAGSIPLLFSPEIVSATTIGGTMVIGLAPVFVLWKFPAPKSSFHLSVWTGVTSGIILVLGLLPESLQITSGKYAALLSVNIYGTILCFILYLGPIFFKSIKGDNRFVTRSH